MPAITCKDLSKTYLIYGSPKDRLKQFLMRGRRIYFREFKALNNLSLEVKRGETLGIVGRNGSGKSTLLQIICGTLNQTSGSCEVSGRISALLELGAGFNPEFTGRENVFLNASILGMSEDEIKTRFDSIVEFSGIGEAVEQPVKTYSSGMYVRLAFAIAVSADPDILIVDEALSVGDEAFQRKCTARIREIKERGGTVLFVSHSASAIVQLCDRAILIDRGELLMDGSPKQVIDNYHKLIFAPEDRQEEVRTGIRDWALGVENKDKPNTKCPMPNAFLSPLTPESTVIYESAGAVISNARIETPAGEAVNMLNRGEEYVYCFDVEFAEPAFRVLFGMLIKTTRGVELGGSSSALENDAISAIDAGSKASVRFSFTCSLLPGTYFLNCGCSAIKSGARAYLHRIVDACMFKVLPDTSIPFNGIVDFGIRTEVDVV